MSLPVTWTRTHTAEIRAEDLLTALEQIIGHPLPNGGLIFPTMHLERGKGTIVKLEWTEPISEPRTD